MKKVLIACFSLTGKTQRMAQYVTEGARIYQLLTLQWINYLQYLKGAYPFLFSLALRTNPFVEKPSAIVR